MCLIFLAYNVWDEHPLVVAANRDEFYGRPSSALRVWDDDPLILGGRDLEAGGTWLAVHKSGRFAAVTNYRSAGVPGPGTVSRGELVCDFLRSGESVGAHLEQLRPKANQYNGFSLLIYDGARVAYFSNRAGQETVPELLEPGIYGLSNHLLDTPWPKVLQGKLEFERLRGRGVPVAKDLFALLGDRLQPDSTQRSATGMSRERERDRHLAAPFIVGDSYGTRCSSVLILGRNGTIEFHEQSYGPGGEMLGLVSVDEQVSSPDWRLGNAAVGFADA